MISTTMLWSLMKRHRFWKISVRNVVLHSDFYRWRILKAMPLQNNRTGAWVVASILLKWTEKSGESSSALAAYIVGMSPKLAVIGRIWNPSVGKQRTRCKKLGNDFTAENSAAIFRWWRTAQFRVVRLPRIGLSSSRFGIEVCGIVLGGIKRLIRKINWSHRCVDLWSKLLYFVDKKSCNKKSTIFYNKIRRNCGCYFGEKLDILIKQLGN